jgi:hypothetical protein
MHVPPRCSIVGESAGALCIYINSQWKMNLRKQLILAVEEAMDPDGSISDHSGHLN